MPISGKRVSPRMLFSVLAVAVTAALAMSLLAGAFASGRHIPKVHFSIFSHPKTIRAHRAATSSVEPPSGAILAGVAQSNGAQNEIYAWHQTSQEDCLVIVEGGAAVTTACGRLSEAAENGVEVATKPAHGDPTITILLPDGVKSAIFTDSDGSHLVDVVNNVAEYSAPGLVSASYTMPNGTAKVTPVALPHAPAPDSTPGPSPTN